MELGLAIGLFAAAIAAILPGMGSAKAVVWRVKRRRVFPLKRRKPARS